MEIPGTDRGVIQLPNVQTSLSFTGYRMDHDMRTHTNVVRCMTMQVGSLSLD